MAGHCFYFTAKGRHGGVHLRIVDEFQTSIMFPVDCFGLLDPLRRAAAVQTPNVEDLYLFTPNFGISTLDEQVISNRLQQLIPMINVAIKRGGIDSIGPEYLPEDFWVAVFHVNVHVQPFAQSMTNGLA